jgi:hypothetical protein
MHQCMPSWPCSSDISLGSVVRFPPAALGYFLPINFALRCGPQPSAPTRPPNKPKSGSPAGPTGQQLRLDQDRVTKISCYIFILTYNYERSIKLQKLYLSICNSKSKVLYMKFIRKSIKRNFKSFFLFADVSHLLIFFKPHLVIF